MPPDENSLTATKHTSETADTILIGPDLNQSRSPFDKKHYRQILLPNGLRAVLVSDVIAMTQAYNGGGLYSQEAADDVLDDDDDDDDNSSDDESSFSGSSEAEHGIRDAAAAMVVGVGSLYDPPECQGMAHFLEHLLFMGSKKYPEDNAYDKFMSKHGGSNNAFTEDEHTVYHFEIPQEHLAAALDIFAQFFIHPLMQESSVDRELNAIESEFQLVKNSDSCRADHLMRYTCGRTFEEHPFAKFGWGNYKSLKEIPEKAQVNPLKILREFYGEHYYASNMRLVVVGGYSLDYLQEHVIKSFTPIRSKEPLGSYTWKQTCQSPLKQYGVPFAAESLKRIFYVVPVRDDHSLSVSWQLPSQIDNWRSKPCDYIAHLIGHEGKGSLLASLKSKLWVTACSAGVGDGGEENASTHALFRVTFTLSEEGVDMWEEVVSELYTYIGMLRYYCEKGLPKWIFEELQSIYNVAHKYADEQSPEDFAVDLAEEMSPWWNTPPERLLDANGLLFDYDSNTIRNLLNENFRPSNGRIVMFSTRFGRSADFENNMELLQDIPFGTFKPGKEALPPSDQFFFLGTVGPPHIEPMFGTPFWCQQLSEAQLISWSKCSQPKLPPADSILSLPQPNEFIPVNFELKTLPPSDSHHPLLHCSIKLQIAVGKRKQWFPAAVTQYDSVKNRILCHYEDETQRWHTMDVALSELMPSTLTSPDFEGSLDKKTVKYKIVSVAVEGEKALMKFGDESDFDVESGEVFPAIPPAAPRSRLPTLVSNSGDLRFWHLQDRIFKRPIADLRLLLHCAEVGKSALHSACSDILVNLVSEYLTEIAYSASVCELKSSLSSNERGFTLRVHGFDDKLLKLFLIILETILKFRDRQLIELPEGLCEHRFKLMLEDYHRSTRNSEMKASKLASGSRIRCLCPGSYSPHQKLQAVKNIDISTFLRTIANVMEKMGAEGLFHGNVDTVEANNAKEKILKLLQSSNGSENSGRPSKKKHQSQLVTKLPTKPCTVTLAAQDPMETNAAVEVYLQVGKDNTLDRVMVDLLMEMMEEPMYNQIRTLDQFGYSVSCDSRWTSGIIGMHFCVVTPSKTAQETEDRIERFLTEFRQTLVDMSSKEYLEHLVGLATEKLNMFHSLSEETEHYWSEIHDRRYKWEVEREDVTCLKTINKKQLLKAYDEWIAPKNKKRKKLVIKVIASEGPASEGRPDVPLGEVEKYNDKSVDDFLAFCKNQTFGKIY